MISVPARHVLRFVRYGALAVLLTIAPALWVLQDVSASIDEAMLDLGSSLMMYPGSEPTRARRLHLNGARVHFRAHTVDAPLEAVLAHYESLCGHGDGQLSERLIGLGRSLEARKVRGDLLRSLSTLASRGRGRGYVACLDLGRGRLTLDELASRLARFSEHGDLSEVGDVRYVYAHGVEGRAERTFVLSMWTSGAFNFHELLPSAGRDAAGRDLAEVPRPPSSQRILNAVEEGSPSAVVVYLVEASTPSAVEAFYRETLPSHGWREIAYDSATHRRADPVSLVAFQKAAEMVAVNAHSAKSDQTVVTILKAGSP